MLVACAAVYLGQQSIQAQGVAPGGPGGKADWLPANKNGVGTSHTTLSKVWFTLEGGRLSEVYYPRLDTPSVRNLDFMITDGHSFAARAQDASSSTTRLVGPDHGRRDNKGKPNSLIYQIINTDRPLVGLPTFFEFGDVAYDPAQDCARGDIDAKFSDQLC